MMVLALALLYFVVPLKAFSLRNVPVPPVGSNNDRVIFGTAAISQAESPFDILDKAHERGVRRFDLARTYGQGKSEEIFGKWMESRNIDRRSVTIITKGGMGNDKYGDPERELLTRSCLMGEVEASLSTLKVDDVDMYMYHRDDPRISVKQFVLWANEIVEEGKSHAWGVSNWSFERFVEAHEFATKEGLIPPTSNSPQLSLAAPACEVWPTTYSVAGDEHQHQIEWYNSRGVELICWEVLAKGFMAVPDLWCEESVDQSFLQKEVEVGSSDWRLQRIQKAYCTEENYRRRRNAVSVAKEHGKSLAQIAALYAMSISPNVSVILGFLEPNQIDDVADLHNYYFDKACVVGDSDAIRDSPKLINLGELLPTSGFESSSRDILPKSEEILV